MEKRKALFAREDPSTGALVAGDPRQPLCTEAPLDILLARRLVTGRQHRAGWTYAILAWLRAGRPFARSQLAAMHESAPPMDWEPPDEAHAASRYAAAFVALQQSGYMPLHAVVDVAQHQQATACRLAHLVIGLDALVRHFEREGKQRRAANAP